MKPSADALLPPSPPAWKAFQKSWKRPISATLLLLLLTLLGWGLYVGGWQVWAEYHYRAALRAIEQAISSQTQARLRQAKAHLLLCLQVRTESLDATFLAARTARRAQAYDEAETLLRRYENLGGVDEAVNLERVLSLVQQGDLSKRGALWSWVQRDHPNKILILEALAKGSLATYQYSTALLCLERWLDLQPNAIEAIAGRGQLRWVLRQDDEAIEDDERALQLDPECDVARLNLAEILIYNHKPKEALPHFEILTERQPGNIAVALGLGRCKVELGQTEEARKLFDRLVRVKPDDPVVLAESGKLLLDTGEVKEAEVRLRQALRLAPYEPEALYSMARCLGQLGKKEEARQYQAKHDRVDKALDKLKVIAKRIMQSPNDGGLRCDMAETMMEHGLLIEARRWLDDAIRVDPKYARAYLLYGKYYELAGKPDLAETCRQRAREFGTSP